MMLTKLLQAITSAGYVYWLKEETSPMPLWTSCSQQHKHIAAMRDTSTGVFAEEFTYTVYASAERRLSCQHQVAVVWVLPNMQADSTAACP